ncbi:MAG TPA: hypothetical protein VM070_05755 [Candidatus Saccharimonadales bacterium]|nr:hypothetical protein [Candidatus Saccharimonadales bacterium]
MLIDAMVVPTSRGSFVATDDKVSQDVFGQLDGAFEFPGLLGRKGELENGVLTVPVLADLVGEAPPDGRADLLDLSAERGDRVLQAIADRGEALFIGLGLNKIHELVWTHGGSATSFPWICCGP